jgi:hypothetical protein
MKIPNPKFKLERTRRGRLSLRNLPGWILLLSLGPLLFVGCKRKDAGQQILAKVGDREFTRRDLEGQRLGLDKDPAVKEKLAALKSDLYRSRLLADHPPPLPSDSVVYAYYQEHEKEFLRPTDAYLIELYWAEDINRLMEFRQQLAGGDTSLLAQKVVITEGRWFAQAGDLDSTLEQELDGLDAGAITLPRPYGDGYRIVRLLEKYPDGTVLSLDAVRDEIVQRLLIEESRRRQEELVTDLRQRYSVQVLVKDSL